MPTQYPNLNERESEFLRRAEAGESFGISCNDTISGWLRELSELRGQKKTQPQPAVKAVKKADK